MGATRLRCIYSSNDTATVRTLVRNMCDLTSTGGSSESVVVGVTLACWYADGQA